MSLPVRCALLFRLSTFCELMIWRSEALIDTRQGQDRDLALGLVLISLKNGIRSDCALKRRSRSAL